MHLTKLGVWKSYSLILLCSDWHIGDICKHYKLEHLQHGELGICVFLVINFEVFCFFFSHVFYFSVKRSTLMKCFWLWINFSHLLQSWLWSYRSSLMLLWNLNWYLGDVPASSSYKMTSHAPPQRVRLNGLGTFLWQPVNYYHLWSYWCRWYTLTCVLRHRSPFDLWGKFFSPKLDPYYHGELPRGGHFLPYLAMLTAFWPPEYQGLNWKNEPCYWYNSFL